MVNEESILKIKDALTLGDQAEIARITNLSKPTVNYILNAKRGIRSGANQELVINAALDIIAKRQKVAGKYTKRINDLLG